ncbi:hypothetical protein [Flagellimonas eckloniae]|uniref:DUF4890 domain-containing protein n=1 Tax=Flagellimonas eckloniae TaxID=346185 RepID=A0A0Q0X0J1_9FLAO|nr:hypothetical protein [Allomuricauda eckloniae]KQC31149.1 hypothetical protein AAY42_15550 [Allomuricauda eckloniae]
MKRLVVVLVLLATVGAIAQKRDNQRIGKGQKADLSVEQLATLQTKKLTLVLDLTSEQQRQVMEINLEEAEMRKEKFAERKAKKESGEVKKPTADERFEMQSARLDHQIAQQQKMKEVLNEEQYQIWKKLKLRKAENGKKKMQEKGRRG